MRRPLASDYGMVSDAPRLRATRSHFARSVKPLDPNGPVARAGSNAGKSHCLHRHDLLALVLAADRGGCEAPHCQMRCRDLTWRVAWALWCAWTRATLFGARFWSMVSAGRLSKRKHICGMTPLHIAFVVFRSQQRTLHLDFASCELMLAT